MKLLDLEIRNLKSITSAKLTFPARGDFQVSLLYGDNGAGKTTVLEAISLLGHVSTMRQVCAHGIGVQPDVAPSSFRQHKEHAEQHLALRDLPHERYDVAAFADQLSLIKERGLDTWWNSTSVSGSPYRPARLKYRLRYQKDIAEFYISFLQGHDLSITEALSRDQSGPGEKIHDGNMDNWFAIVYDQAQQEQVKAFIDHMRLVSPHSYWSGTGEYRTDPRTLKRPESESIVAYWNTDLNDFGRKNDLRESVKKIRIDFKGQMITRLGLALPYGSSTNPQYYEMTDTERVNDDKLVAPNESIKRALVDHAVAMQGEHKKLKEGLIYIPEIDATQTLATMKARRINDDKIIEIDHLSAGENESIFIFLLMHGMPCKDSIILLDEPDLHLSDFAKSRFYAELYRVAQTAQCQLIISTHSAFAYQKARHFSQFFIRREDELDEQGTSSVIYRTDWDKRFGELLTFHYARCAINAMREAGVAWSFLSWPLRASIWIGERLGLEVWVLITFFVTFIGLYSLWASSNDLFLFVVSPDPVRHKRIIVFGFRVCVFLCVMCSAIRFIPQRMRHR